MNNKNNCIIDIKLILVIIMIFFVGREKCFMHHQGNSVPPWCVVLCCSRSPTH